MDDDQIRAQMELIVAQQARHSAEIIDLKSQISVLQEVQAVLTRGMSDRTESVGHLNSRAQTNRVGYREAMDRLVAANEVTRALTEEVARCRNERVPQQEPGETE